MKLFKILLTVFVFAILLFLLIFFPVGQDNSLINTVLGITTFLFGIFISFSISDRYNRLNKIYELDSVERSKLILLCRVSSIFGTEVQDKFKIKIDKYLTRNLDYKVWDYYKTEPEFDAIIDFVKSLDLKTNKQQSTYESMLSMLSDVSNARVECISLIGEKLAKIEWLVFLIFAIVIAGCLIIINTGAIIAIFIVFVLILSLILLLGLLFSLDNLSWKEEKRTFEPYAKTFEAIGLLRYYPKEVIDSGRVKPPLDKDYRLAVYTKPYPDFTGMKVEIIKAKR